MLESRLAVDNILSTLAEPLGMINTLLATLARLGRDAVFFFLYVGLNVFRQNKPIKMGRLKVVNVPRRPASRSRLFTVDVETGGL
jgi:hypothetical protein